MWVAIFGMLERLIAVPIDTPIMILKGFIFNIPALTKENYYKYGPIHRALNKFKMVMLCKVPKKAWPDYTPENGIMIYYDRALRDLINLCSNEGIAMFEKCIDKEYDILDELNRRKQSEEELETNFDEDNKGRINKAFAELDELYAQETDECDFAEYMSAGINVDTGEDQVTPECVEAARKVLKAAYDDALYNYKGGNNGNS